MGGGASTGGGCFKPAKINVSAEHIAKVLQRANMRMTIAQQKFGTAAHPEVAGCYRNLAYYYQLGNQLDLAAQNFQLAVDMFIATVGESHKSTKNCKKLQNKLFEQQGTQ